MAKFLSIVSLIWGKLGFIGTLAGGPLAWLSAVFSFISTLWGTELGRIVIVAAGCLIGGWTWGWEHEHAVKVAAVAQAIESRDTAWKKQFADANTASEDRLRSALAAAREIPQAPTAKADLLDLCKRDTSCRKALKQSSR